MTSRSALRSEIHLSNKSGLVGGDVFDLVLDHVYYEAFCSFDGKSTHYAKGHQGNGHKKQHYLNLEVCKDKPLSHDAVPL